MRRARQRFPAGTKRGAAHCRMSGGRKRHLTCGPRLPLASTSRSQAEGPVARSRAEGDASFSRPPFTRSGACWGRRSLLRRRRVTRTLNSRRRAPVCLGPFRGAVREGSVLQARPAPGRRRRRCPRHASSRRQGRRWSSAKGVAATGPHRAHPASADPGSCAPGRQAPQILVGQPRAGGQRRDCECRPQRRDHGIPHAAHSCPFRSGGALLRLTATASAEPFAPSSPRGESRKRGSPAG